MYQRCCDCWIKSWLVLCIFNMTCVKVTFSMKYWNLKSQLINTVITVHSCFDQYCDLHKADSIFHCSYYIGCCWEIFNLLSFSFLSMPWLLRTPLLICFIINQAWWSLVSWPGDVPWLLPASLPLWLESQSDLLWYLQQATHLPRCVCTFSSLCSFVLPILWVTCSFAVFESSFRLPAASIDFKEHSLAIVSMV